jgi:hypothetical protein
MQVAASSSLYTCPRVIWPCKDSAALEKRQTVKQSFEVGKNRKERDLEQLGSGSEAAVPRHGSATRPTFPL